MCVAINGAFGQCVVGAAAPDSVEDTTRLSEDVVNSGRDLEGRFNGIGILVVCGSDHFGVVSVTEGTDLVFRYP